MILFFIKFILLLTSCVVLAPAYDVHSYDIFIKNLDRPLPCYDKKLHIDNIPWITMMDKSYSVRFNDTLYQACFLSSAKKFGVIALDDETYSFFNSKGFPVVLSSGFEKCAIDFIGCVKFDFMYQLITKKISFLFTEADVFWLKNIVLLQDAKYDVQISEHNYSLETNFGVFFIQSNLQTIQMMENIITFLKDKNNLEYKIRPRFAYDQKIFDYAVRGCEKDVWLCNYENKKIFQKLIDYKVFIREIKFKRLEFSLVPHLNEKTFDTNNIYVAHVWGGTGTERTKTACRTMLPPQRCFFNK